MIGSFDQSHDCYFVSEFLLSKNFSNSEVPGAFFLNPKSDGGVTSSGILDVRD